MCQLATPGCIQKDWWGKLRQGELERISEYLWHRLVNWRFVNWLFICEGGSRTAPTLGDNDCSNDAGLIRRELALNKCGTSNPVLPEKLGTPIFLAE